MFEDIVDFFKNLKGSTRIKNETRDEIEGKLLDIRINCSRPEDDYDMEEILEILEKSKYTVGERDDTIKKLENIVDRINKRNININITVEEETKKPQNKNIILIDKIEDENDCRSYKYKNYTENHPMDGISYNTFKNKYTVRFDNIERNFKNLDDACNIILDKICKDDNILWHDDMLGTHDSVFEKKIFKYSDKNFISYFHNNNIYFDIQHITSMLDVTKEHQCKKYNKFKLKMVYRSLYKNKFGGYFIRELIDEQTTYDIFLSSNSSFAKSFKQNVSKILVDLRKNGQIIIEDEKFVVNPKIKKQIKTIVPVNAGAIEPTVAKIKHSNMIENLPDPYTNPTVIAYTYNNPSTLNILWLLIMHGVHISLSKFIGNKHILYAFLIPIDPIYCIIKFGYTYDILDRIISLRSEYKSNVYLVGIKLVNAEKDEKIFHKMLKLKYPSLVYPYSINNKEKVELYKYNPKLMMDFDEYTVKTEQELIEPKNISDVDQEILDSVKNQEVLFHNFMDKLGHVDSEITDKIHQRHHEEFMITSQNALESKKNITKNTEANDNKEERQHQQLMADKKLTTVREEQILEEKRAKTLIEHNKNLELRLKLRRLTLKKT